MLEKLILAARQRDPHISHEVISLGELGVVGQRLVNAQVKVRSLGMRSSISSLPKLIRLVWWIRPRGRPTVVQTWLWHADLFGGVAARITGNARVVWNLRNALAGDPSQSRSSRFVSTACALVSRCVPAKIICNAQAAQDTHSAIGYDKTKCVVIPNGFDVERFSRQAQLGSEQRLQWGVQRDEFLVGLVARLDPLKDHSNFVLAASHITSRLANVRFVLVGEGVPTSLALRDLIERLGLTERFTLEGRKDDIPVVMSAMDAFCLSSKSEGFPNVLGEAMACETPCVTTDVGEARSMLGDDRWVAPSNDPLALAQRVLGLAELPPAELRALGQAQRARVQTRFGIDRVWRSYRNIYESL